MALPWAGLKCDAMGGTRSAVLVTTKAVAPCWLLLGIARHHCSVLLHRSFNFDVAIQSGDHSAPGYGTQETVHEVLGKPVLDNAMEGFNACVFAYGQTGSGKTHTMMGPPSDPGLIPQLCKELFARIGANADSVQATVEASYCEVYNERVFDLLGRTGSEISASKMLKVREHKILGPYVEGLTSLSVTDFDMIKSLMEDGHAFRHTSRTAMNDTSSRSHAIFTIVLRQQENRRTDGGTAVAKISKINLVDLAGSERQSKAETSNARLKEGANINKSLSTLGMVIHALAKKSSKGRKSNPKSSSDSLHIPYRNSTLTWLLKDSFGGNSKTVMIASINPSASNYEESLSTLKYADQAKRIMNKAIVNEGPARQQINNMQAEISELKQRLQSANSGDEELRKLKAKLQESESLLKGLNMTWEERMVLTRRELERVAEAAKKRAEAAEKESLSLKRELNVRRHKGRRTLNDLAKSFRAKEGKEKSLRQNAERRAEQLERQIKELLEKGNQRNSSSSSRNISGGGAGGGGDGSGASDSGSGGGGGAKKVPRQRPQQPSGVDTEGRKKFLPVPECKADPQMILAVNALELSIANFRNTKNPAAAAQQQEQSRTSSSSGSGSSVGNTAAFHAQITADRPGGKSTAPSSRESPRIQAAAADSAGAAQSHELPALRLELTALDREMAAAQSVIKAQMPQNTNSMGDQRHQAVSTLQRRASALEARRGIVLGEIHHRESIVDADESPTNSHDVAWTLAYDLRAANAARAKHVELLYKLEHVYSSSVDVVKTAVAKSPSKGKSVAPLLGNVLNNVEDLEKELRLSQNTVQDLELRVDTQVLATMRQANGAGNPDGAALGTQRAALVAARKERDRVNEDVARARIRHLKLLFELKDNLETGASTSLTLAEMEDTSQQQKDVHSALSSADTTVMEQEIGLSKIVLSNFDSTAINGLIPKVSPKRGVALHAFDGDVSNNQLPTKKGEDIQVVDQISDQWYFCVDASGKSGLVPCSYVQTKFGSTLPSSPSRSASPSESSPQPTQFEIDDDDLMYHAPSIALGLVFGATTFLDVMDLNVAESRHESACILLEELRSSRAQELKNLWMLAEERRALEAALRCAKPGQFMSIRDRLGDIQRSASSSHTRCRLLANVTSSAAARVGCTLQSVKNIGDLETFAPSGSEWLQKLFDQFTRLKDACRELSAKHTKLSKTPGWTNRFPANSSGERDRDDFPAEIRACLEGAKAVRNKAEDAVAKQIMRLASHTGMNEAGALVKTTTAIKSEMLERVASEILEEKALLLSNLLLEEQMNIARRTERLLEEKNELTQQSESPASCARLAAVSKFASENDIRSSNVAAGLQKTQEIAEEATKKLANTEASTASGLPSAIVALSSIMRFGQHMRLQDASLMTQLLQMGTIEWNHLDSLTGAMRVMSCEDYERLVQQLVFCQVGVFWWEASQADLSFDLLLAEYTIDVYRHLLQLGDAAVADSAKHCFISAMIERAQIVINGRRRAEEWMERHHTYSALMLKLQSHPEPGSGLQNALGEARLRLNTIRLERAYAQLAVASAHAHLIYAEFIITLNPKLRKTKQNLAEMNPGPIFAAHMEKVQADILESRSANKHLFPEEPLDTRAETITEMRNAFRRVRVRTPWCYFPRWTLCFNMQVAVGISTICLSVRLWMRLHI